MMRGSRDQCMNLRMAFGRLLPGLPSLDLTRQPTVSLASRLQRSLDPWALARANADTK